MACPVMFILSGAKIQTGWVKYEKREGELAADHFNDGRAGDRGTAGKTCRFGTDTELAFIRSEFWYDDTLDS